jgi:tetratricopeptide (TPR) repeat protein
MTQSRPNKKWEEARALLANYQNDRAFPAYEKLIRQFPNEPELWLEYGGAARGMRQFKIAFRAWERASELAPQDSDLLVQIGQQYNDLRQPDKARAFYEQAIDADPRNSNARIAMARFLERGHRFAEAREEVDACLKANPKDEQGRYYDALLDRRENKLEDAERHLRDLIGSNPEQPYVQYSSRYELAEVLNRTGRFDEAMNMLIEAKALVRRTGDVNVVLRQYEGFAAQWRRAALPLPKDILGTWAKQFPKRDRSEIPNLAFLGGHPRSGTTLLEQVLGTNSSVAAFDEPRAFRQVVWELYHATPQFTPARLNIIRKRYFEALADEGDSNWAGKVVLDKNPAPTANLPIWLRVFPELRVVIALRDPRDVVISCFFQNLRLNPFSANYLTLARTAKRYADLMDVWLAAREWTGLTWLESRYEDTVTNLEKEGRRVTEFLGLSWDQAQARFYESSRKKQIRAPTYHDASQPIYDRALARWRSYEKHLEPIMPILEPYCRALGYS